MLRQSFSDNNIKGINLKGDLVDLGCVEDVECQSCNDGILNIELSINDNSSLVFKFPYYEKDEDGKVKFDTFNDTLIPASHSPNIETITQCSLFTNQFQYISAFRWGPQKTYERDTKVVQYQRQISQKNGQCEYAVHFLSHYGKRMHCHSALLSDNEGDDTLETQTVKWMQTISPKVRIKIGEVGKDLILKYKFSREENTMTDDMYAINVGYGITYVLPIVIAILSAEPGALILIENPEAHIHPRAQAELMKLIMKAAKAGIQIIIETHSDHIMNGALVAIAQDSKNSDLVKAYFFERDEHTHTSVPRSLEILKDGRIVNPPKGFFDQIDIDMRLIMGF